MIFLKIVTIIVISNIFNLNDYLIILTVAGLFGHIILEIPYYIYEFLVLRKFKIKEYNQEARIDINDYIYSQYKLRIRPRTVIKVLKDKYEPNGYTFPWTNW